MKDKMFYKGYHEGMAYTGPEFLIFFFCVPLVLIGFGLLLLLR